MPSIVLYWFLLVSAWSGTLALADENPFTPHVQVTASYVELRSGPAWAYPVQTVSERHDWLQIIIRKTDWIKVLNRSGELGWIHVDDLLAMNDPQGDQVSLVEPKFDDFNTRKWEAGLLSGQFDGSSSMSLYAGYWLTNNLSTELTATQVLGDSSEIIVVNGSLLHQPFPSWRVSPYFSLGAGKIFISPKATLSSLDKRNEDTLNVAIGLRYYLSDRYFLRAEVRDYKVFTNRESNEEATEWKVGLSVFF